MDATVLARTEGRAKCDVCQRETNLRRATSGGGSRGASRTRSTARRRRQLAVGCTIVPHTGCRR